MKTLWKKKFIDLYFNSNPKKRDIPRALELKNSNMPNFLYQYNPFDNNRHKCHLLELLKNDKMWLSNPEDFNDPFDCAITLISKQIEVENFRHRIDNIINDLECEFTDDERDYIKKSIDPAYELSKIYAKKFIPTDKTPKKLIEALSKPEEYAKVISDALKEEADDFYPTLLKDIKKNMRITCFSEKNDSILMWSHYADNHRGLCVEYDFKGSEYRNPLKQFLYPVIYETKVFDATKSFLPCSRCTDLFRHAAITKYQDWSYENEWRYVDVSVMPGSSPSSYLNVTKPKSVYLGAKTDEEDDDIKEVQKIAEDRGFAVYKMEMMDSEFVLKPKRII